jgi:predicted nuclease of predicted toxin-antitoxin system
MLFKVDENLPEAVADRLRASGHDALSVPEQGLAGAGDERLKAVIQGERRAFLTLDLGFADIRRHPPEEFSGLIVFRLACQDREHVLAVVESLMPFLLHNPLERRLWIVRNGELRIRE